MTNCELCYHFHHEESLDSLFACNCCENGSFFELITDKRPSRLTDQLSEANSKQLFDDFGI